MGKPPQRPKVQLPSPLAQVHYTRPLSQPPQEMGLVRDPAFWKRFSTAAHQADSEKVSQSSIDTKDQWLIQQHKEKRRCRVMCVVITMTVIMVIVAAAVCGWYFTTQFRKEK